ncbi:unnamed protein product [Rotaria sp. Silwood2]|nr:unnamed protein product [Rotaria sp. Silwood2]CAF3010090.1 unnamed protein product [Rotaria sp. Silwood2]CAF3381568.1 unnamed protein product [Rotaria sp. Silwood2]CAF3488270.1 unnamed protein product [Rotaria sp. Silwood2]CAF4468685.1 unnamed protein product [Rotaria sp. Silwood2]
MGAFTPRDICNIDESPLQLFGDQGKRSIIDMGTPNDIEENLSSKRKGQISPREKSQYAEGVNIFFTPKRVINGSTRNQYVQSWWSQIKDSHPKLLIDDSANSHLNPDLILDLRKKRVVVAIVPKGCTMYVQVLDVSIFSVFKNHYDDVVEEYIEKNGPRSKIKLTAS